MNESKCRATLPSANHVSSSNTAQVGCMLPANTRISVLCASYVQTYNPIR